MLVFTVEGGDLDLIREIHSEIFAPNQHFSFKPRSSQSRPFLLQLPDGTNVMSLSKDFLSDICTLTIRCTSLNTCFDVFLVVGKEFKVTCAPGDKFSGMIEGLRDKGIVASAQVISYKWPILNPYDKITSSVSDAIELSKLKFELEVLCTGCKWCLESAVQDHQSAVIGLIRMDSINRLLQNHSYWFH